MSDCDPFDGKFKSIRYEAKRIPVVGDDLIAQHIDLLVAALQAVVLGACRGATRAGLLFLQDFTHYVCVMWSKICFL